MLESLFLSRHHLRANDKLILAHLLEAHRCCSGQTDFLFASIAGGTPALHEVKEGRTARVEAAWLGSASAFDCYQRAYHTKPWQQADGTRAKNPEKAALLDMHDAFREVVESRHEFAEVGDFVIEARTIDEGFAYRRMAWSFPNFRTTSSEWERVDFGTGAEGTYAYSVLCGDYVGLPFLAIYSARRMPALLSVPTARTITSKT